MDLKLKEQVQRVTKALEYHFLMQIYLRLKIYYLLRIKLKSFEAKK